MKLEKEEFKLNKDLNNDFEFTPIATKNYIIELVELHIDPSWSYGPGQEEFLRSKFEYLIKFEAEGFGQRYVMKDGDKLIADLGIYHKDQLARFNDVVTHADYRNRGLCFTLVSNATDYIIKNSDVETLIMHADENYFAQKIYGKVGFQEAEKLVAIERVS